VGLTFKKNIVDKDYVFVLLRRCLGVNTQIALSEFPQVRDRAYIKNGER